MPNFLFLTKKLLLIYFLNYDFSQWSKLKLFLKIFNGLKLFDRSLHNDYINRYKSQTIFI